MPDLRPDGLAVLLHGVRPRLPQGPRLQAEENQPHRLLRLLGEVQVPLHRRWPPGGAPGHPQAAHQRDQLGGVTQRPGREHLAFPGPDRGQTDGGAASVQEGVFVFLFLMADNSQGEAFEF